MVHLVWRADFTKYLHDAVMGLARKLTMLVSVLPKREIVVKWAKMESGDANGASGPTGSAAVP